MTIPPTPTTTTTTTTDAPTTIWLTDRTRFNAGVRRCPRQRYLSNHAGHTGYGLTLRKLALPLMTGSSVHTGSQRQCDILQREDRLATLAEMRDLTAQLSAEYTAEVARRGYRGILGGVDTEETIAEQCMLIEGLQWILRIKFFPWLHQNYRVRHVEVERLHFLECDCGALPIDTAEHIRRGCSGIALMLRSDIIAERRAGGNLAYFDLKTSGWDSESRVDQWETDPQLALGTLDALQLWGAEVTEVYIVDLMKGRRVKPRDDERKRQMSALCYGYLRPGNPPFATDDWKPSYEWVNEDGEVKHAGRAYRRTGIWTLPGSDWDFWQQTRAANPELSPSEFWVRQLPESVTDRVCAILGPMNRQDAQLAATRRGMLGEERRWRQTLWAAYEQSLSHAWSSVEFQAWLDLHIPCSWQCRPFGKEHQCEFVPVCHRHNGWEDPIGSGHYQPRLPHHDPELRQAIARGLLPAEAELVEEEE